MPQILKRLERSLKLQCLAAARLFFGRGRSGQADLGAVTRIVLIRSDRIGDAILSTPAIEALRRSFPNAMIDLVLGRRNHMIAPLLPFVDNIFSFKNPLGMMATARRLRSRAYDVAIDMLANDSWTAAVLTIGSAARVKIGFHGSFASLYDITLDRPAQREHHVRTLLRLLSPLGVAAPPRGARLSLKLPAEALDAARSRLNTLQDGERRLLIINISGSSLSKFWGVEPYIGLTRALQQRGLQVLLLSAPADHDVLDRIARGAGVAAVPVNPNLAEVAALLSFADVVVSPDTSIVHIAAALGRPVVDLVPYPELGVEFGPWGVEHRVVSGETGMGDIRESQVLDAIDNLLQNGAVQSKSVREG